MDLGGGVPLSEDNSVRGLPGLDFQTGLVPTTPVKPVSARQQTAEGEKGLHWLSTLGISSTGELPVEIAHPTDTSYAATAGIGHTGQAHHLNVPAVYAVYRRRQAYQEKTTRNEHVLDSSASTPIGLCTPTELCTKERVHQDRQHDGATPSKVRCADTQDEPNADQQMSKCQIDNSQQSLTGILVKENISTEKAHADGVDLNRTPPQKPKRKKVRPKVVGEGKLRRTPNKKHASNREQGTPVHTCHRTSTGRRNSKDATTTTTLGVEESIFLPNAARLASCKRSLKFDSDGEACNGKFGSMHQHADERGKATVENPTEPAAFDLHCSLTNIPTSQLPLPENSSPSLLKRKASSMWNMKHISRKKNSSMECPRNASIHARHPGTFFATSQGKMPQSSTQERDDNMSSAPQTCQEALLMDILAQKTTKKCRSQRISHAVQFARCTTVDRPETCTHQGQESRSVHDCQSSSNLKENLTPMFSSEVISFMKPIDEIVHRISPLYIREKDENAVAVLENAIVPYSAEGTIVPYAGTFKPSRKRRPRPKVDLDEETKIAWKLLMGIESARLYGTDADKEKWWEEERRVFQGRADSFIARMHLIQGDRRFSQWKGSVVDSIVGVFLTQNVTDHLSSSAFMALAARFPLNEERETVVVDSSEHTTGSSEHTTGVENQKPMESKLETVSKDGDVQNGNKPRKKVRSNKGKGEALSTKETWEPLRRQLIEKFGLKERTADKKDSLDWQAVRHADVNDVAQAIKERGMNNMLAARIQEFLNRLVEDHGSIDLEWLRDVPPDKAKDFLLSINGLGLKSAECVRLLSLQQLAFPVDTNVGRICVRLGWVPLEPLPESLQLHLLELYPVLAAVQTYLWPRLCKLDQRTLYELHYQLITFGKVFCTKRRPNCNACPMRGECKHFASACASARLSLPASEEKSPPFMDVQGAPGACNHPVAVGPPPAIEYPILRKDSGINKCEPIIEEPETPEPEYVGSSESVVGDANCDDPDEIPTIKLNLEEFTLQMQMKSYIQEKDINFQDTDVSKALVALTPEAASIPTPKLKNMSRLRTEHHVYELPDDHCLLEGLDKREPDDPCFYLLAIWTPGETAESIEPPKACCDFQASGHLCNKQTCFSCNVVRETTAQTVKGTLLIPCRTAMRGSFPLNGTYFQVNEVFADHESSLNPIDVPRALIWNLKRRTVYFGTSVTTIFRGMTTEEIQYCFWRGFVCVRGFELKTRAPRPLVARFHFPASKQTRNKRNAARKLDE